MAEAAFTTAPIEGKGLGLELLNIKSKVSATSFGKLTTNPIKQVVVLKMQNLVNIPLNYHK